MTEVYVIGASQSDYGAFPEESYRSLFTAAYEGAVDTVDNKFDEALIDEAYVGTLGVGGRQIGLSGPAVTEHVGLHGVSCTRIENACAASGTALRQATLAIKSGLVDVALAGGFEVMTDMSGKQTRYWLGVSGETEWERMAGTTFAGVYAQMADAHMAKHGTTREQLSRVSVKNHANGAKNPHAHLGFECSLEEAMAGTPVADPLNLYDCCPTSDGASVAIVANEEVAREFTEHPVRIAGAGQASARVGLFQRPTLTGLPASRKAAEQAYEQAGLGPADVDFAEVHDCFSIAELMAYEDLGFCEEGEAGSYIERGATAPDGECPVNLSGGLKSKGHPIGATGTGQTVEVFKQLRGEAGDRQVDGVETGLSHNVGGSGGAAVVTVYEGGWE